MDPGLTDEEIIQFWGVENLFRWAPEAVAGTWLPPSARRFLTSVGLPRSLGPLKAVVAGEDPAAFSRLAGCAHLLRLAVEPGNPEHAVWLNDASGGWVLRMGPDEARGGQFINSSPRHLASFLTLWEAYCRAGEHTAAAQERLSQLGKLAARFWQVDPAAVEPTSGFWPSVLVAEQLRLGGRPGDSLLVGAWDDVEEGQDQRRGLSDAEILAACGSANLFRWTPEAVAPTSLPPAAKRFLTRVGIPRDPRPYSMAKVGGDPNVLVRLEGHFLALCSEYEEVVAPFCLDERTGCVLCADRHPPRFVNSSVRAFASFILLAWAAPDWQQGGRAPDSELLKELDEFTARARAIDPRAFADAGYWWPDYIREGRVELGGSWDENQPDGEEESGDE